MRRVTPLAPLVRGVKTCNSPLVRGVKTCNPPLSGGVKTCNPPLTRGVRGVRGVSRSPCLILLRLYDILLYPRHSRGSGNPEGKPRGIVGDIEVGLSPRPCIALPLQRLRLLVIKRLRLLVIKRLRLLVIKRLRLLVMKRRKVVCSSRLFPGFPLPRGTGGSAFVAPAGALFFVVAMIPVSSAKKNPGVYLIYIR